MRGKSFLLILLTTLVVSGAGRGGWSTAVPAMAHARDVADVSVFYEPLTPYGTWITVEAHGLVWVPRGVPPGWRPYTDGRWIYTEVGWTWVSDWEWGWAPFHYGRWFFSPHHGWYWVPGTVWGPAWVVWRRTPGWVGWAPLPPSVGFHVGIGLGAAHISVDIAPAWFSFVEERHMLAPHIRTFLAPPTRNVHLVHITRNVTNYVVVHNRVVNHSIDVTHIEKVIKRPVVVHRIVEVDSPEQAHGPRVREKEREVVLRRPAVARGYRDDGDRERHDAGRPGASEVRERREERGERQRWQEQPANERAAVEERQRQERRNRPEGGAAEALRQRHKAEREAFEEKMRHQQPPWRQEQVQEQRREERSGTAEDRHYRDRREVQQKQSRQWQEAPRTRTAEDEERYDRRQRQRQTQAEQDADRRRLIPADQGNNRAASGERPVRLRELSPEERHGWRETVRPAVEAEDTKRHNRRGRQQQTREEQGADRHRGTPAN